MFIANDPYNGGGTHLPDINVDRAGVRRQAASSRYVANIAHHADVGGMVPGSEAAVCQVDLPGGHPHPAGADHARGKLNRDVFDLILLNSRTPDERVGDLQAQFAANTVGMRSVLRLFERYGVSRHRSDDRGLSRFHRKALPRGDRQLPAGRYEAEDFLDGDGEGQRCENHGLP